MSEITSEIKEITPEEAVEFLARNNHNRKVARVAVNRMVSEMLTGEWHFDGAPIRFADDGTLLDGQHRLTAVVESGVAQKFVIITGLPKESQAVMDTGKKRSLADMLTMNGERNASNLATLAAIAYKWDNGLRAYNLFRGNAYNVNNAAIMAPSIPLLLDYIEQHPDLRDIIRPSNAVSRVLGTPPSIMYAAWWALYAIDYDDAETFFKSLRDGAGLEPGSPILALRNRLVEIGRDAADRGKNVTTEHALALIFKAWNAYRQGRSITRLYFKPGGANPEPFPEPR